MALPAAGTGAANYSSYGSTGGSTANPAAGTGGGGMSGMGIASLAAMLGGGLLDYYGQRKGAKSLEDEANRQAAEQEAFSIQRHGRITDEINRFDPQTQQAFATGALLRSQAATAPALAAGGRALGLSGSAVTSAGRSILPAQRLQAAQGGAAGARRIDAERMRALGIDLGGIDDQQQMAAALYPMRSEIASSRGAAYRTGGQVLQGGGLMGLNYAMAQKAGPEAAPAPEAASNRFPEGKPGTSGYTESLGAPTERWSAPIQGDGTAGLSYGLPSRPLASPEYIGAGDMNNSALFRVPARRPVRR